MIDDGYAPDVEYGYDELSEEVLDDIICMRKCFLESYFELNHWTVAYTGDNCKGYCKGGSATLKVYDSYPYDDWDDYLINTVKNIAKIEGKPIRDIVDDIYKAENRVCLDNRGYINRMMAILPSEDLFYIREYVKDKVQSHLEMKRLGWIK